MVLLGFDIGGTKSAVVFGDEKGNIFYREQIPTTSPKCTLEKLFELVCSVFGF